MFIEVHDRATKNPALINVDQIIVMVPDRDKKHCMAFLNESDKWSTFAESYEEVRAMIGVSGEPTIKGRLKLIWNLLEEGRITNNEARILRDLNPVVETQE